MSKPQNPKQAAAVNQLLQEAKANTATDPGMTALHNVLESAKPDPFKNPHAALQLWMESRTTKDRTDAPVCTVERTIRAGATRDDLYNEAAVMLRSGLGVMELLAEHIDDIESRAMVDAFWAGLYTLRQGLDTLQAMRDD